MKCTGVDTMYFKSQQIYSWPKMYRKKVLPLVIKKSLIYESHQYVLALFAKMIEHSRNICFPQKQFVLQFVLKHFTKQSFFNAA